MNTNRRDFIKNLGMSTLALWMANLNGLMEAVADEKLSNEVPTMLYRSYGQTGKKVSLLGMGGGFDYYKAKEGKLDECAELALYAYQKGINYFDSGLDYAAGHSEEILGMAFKEIDRRNQGNPKALPYYFTTKSLIENEKTADDVRRRIESALKNFGKDKIHFFHMWAIMDLNQYREIMKKGGPYEGALQAKKDGLIEHLVFSTHAGGEEVEQIINDDVFEGVLLGYNIINFPRRERGLMAATRKKIGVAIMNPLGGGLIPNNPDYFSFLKDEKRPELTQVQAALAFVMAHSGVSTALSGMKKKEEIDENVSTMKYVKVLNDKELARFKQQCRTDLKELCTTCLYCNKCPVGIPVFHLMDVYNYYLIRGKDYAKKMLQVFNSWYNLKLEDEIGKCIQCRACERICTQRLPILERFEFIQQKIILG